MNKTVIVIPVYKPGSALLTLVEKLISHFSKIVIVDDGSGPEYKTLFDRLKTGQNQITLLKHHVNLGKGRALKTAFNYCLTADWKWGRVITVDADGQHRLKDILNIEKAMANHPDSLILGCRQFKKGQIPFRSKFGNKISCHVMRWLCGIRVSDTQTGLRGIPWSFLAAACKTGGEGYEYETNMLLAAKDQNVQLTEVPIETVYEEGNPSSHFNPITDSFRIYCVILKYSLASLLSALIDFIVFTILIKNRFGVLSATYMARVCSAIINFGVNRNIVFKYKKNLTMQLIKYVILLFVSGTVSGLCVTFLASQMEINRIILKTIVEIMLYFVNYYVQETYIFSSS